MEAALDSNIISYALKGKFGVRDKLVSFQNSGNSYVLPPISYYEVIRWLEYDGLTKRLEKFKDTFLPVSLFDYTFEDWREAIDVYKYCRSVGHIIQEDDILQAGYCINRGYTLVTHNVKHFDGIPGLQFVDWVEDGGTDMSKGSVYD